MREGLLKILWCLSFVFPIGPLMADGPCSMRELIEVAHSISPEEIYRVLYEQLNIDEDSSLEFRAERVELNEGILTFTNPRMNDLVITTEESYCSEFGTSLFGRVICLGSSTRSTEVSLCRSLGLLPLSEDETYLTKRIVQARNERHSSVYNEGQWVSADMNFLVRYRIDYYAIEQVSCRLP